VIPTATGKVVRRLWMIWKEKWDLVLEGTLLVTGVKDEDRLRVN
jgi:DNA recombination-dependent growth factor C